MLTGSEKIQKVDTDTHTASMIKVQKAEPDTPRIRVIDYNEDYYHEHEFKTIQECLQFKEIPSVTWIKLNGIYDINILKELGNHFGIHNIVLEDVMDLNHRAEVDYFEDYIFATLKMLNFDKEKNVITVQQISFILFKDTLISFQEGAGHTFVPVTNRIKNAKTRIRKARSDYLAYALLDTIIDNYFLVLEQVGENVEDLEDELLNNSSDDTIKKIHSLKRQMLKLRKIIWPVRELVNKLYSTQTIIIHKPTLIYIRDLYGQTIQLIDTIESYRDMIYGMLDTYISMTGNKMNEVMKVLTIMASIFIPLTFLTGVYGMNFAYIPILSEPWGLCSRGYHGSDPYYHDMLF
jgi:magnesium transporter